MEKPVSFPFDAIKGRIEDLVRAFDRKLKDVDVQLNDRSDHSFLILRMFALLNENTYRTILYLCSDNTEDRQGKFEFSLSTPALARTILDTIFNTVFIFQDLKLRSKMFRKAAFFKVQHLVEKWEGKYSHDPEWKDDLKGMREYVLRMKNECQITSEDEKEPGKVTFPYPGQMLKHKEDHKKFPLSKKRREFLGVLDELFYKSFSEDSHMTYISLMKRGNFFILSPGRTRTEKLNVARQEYLQKSIVFLVTFFSELELELRFGLVQDLRYLWTFLLQDHDVKKLFSSRYEAKL